MVDTEFVDKERIIADSREWKHNGIKLIVLSFSSFFQLHLKGVQLFNKG